MKKLLLTFALFFIALLFGSLPALAATTVTNNIVISTVHDTPSTFWWSAFPLVSNYSIKISTTTGNTYTKTFNGVSRFTLEKLPNGTATLQFYNNICQRMSWIKGNDITHENRNQLNGGYIKITDTSKTPWIIVNFVNICITQNETVR